MDHSEFTKAIGKALTVVVWARVFDHDGCYVPITKKSALEIADKAKKIDQKVRARFDTLVLFID